MSLTIISAGQTRYVNKPPVLAPLAIASLLCAAVSYSQMKSHKSSGLQRPDKRTSQLFTALIITNILAAAVQLSGVILFVLAVLGEEEFRVQMRQSVLLVCIRSCCHNLSDLDRPAPAHICSAAFPRVSLAP